MSRTASTRTRGAAGSTPDDSLFPPNSVVRRSPPERQHRRVSLTDDRQKARKRERVRASLPHVVERDARLPDPPRDYHSLVASHPPPVSFALHRYRARLPAFDTRKSKFLEEVSRSGRASDLLEEVDELGAKRFAARGNNEGAC